MPAECWRQVPHGAELQRQPLRNGRGTQQLSPDFSATAVLAYVVRSCCPGLCGLVVVVDVLCNLPVVSISVPFRAQSFGSRQCMQMLQEIYGCVPALAGSRGSAS